MSKYTFRAASRIPWQVWANVIWAAIVGLKRTPQGTGRKVRDSLIPAVHITGTGNLPPAGAYIVAANHLNGPGVWVGLAGALLAAAIGDRAPGARIRSVGVAVYRDFKIGFVPVPAAVTEFVFRRFYAVYDIIRMPHIGEGAGARSSAVRQILTALRAGDVVILFPEGRNVENFTMIPIQPGVGDLLRLAAKAGVSTIPGAVYPEGKSFSVSFGPAIQIDVTQSRDEAEVLTGEAIASLLPVRLRGHYASPMSNQPEAAVTRP